MPQWKENSAPVTKYLLQLGQDLICPTCLVEDPATLQTDFSGCFSSVIKLIFSFPKHLFGKSL